ncbi:MAG: endonuclease/exonuclease/phosphatase family protein [Oscillospiraceae bacterium]|nr:endonuclease/exonuclease/phosphatase family protein [Oscillospiraceae bacterium]
MKVKKILKIVLCVVLALVIVVGGYLAYVFIDYHRLSDRQELTVHVLYKGGVLLDNDDYPTIEPATGTRYRIASYNIGFGAYSDDYGFFMDGGTESRARSAEAVVANIGGAVDTLGACSPDLMLIQEVDTDGTRSYHIDESELLLEDLSTHFAETALFYDFAQNYDSPYLMYPLTSPHGANKAGIMTFSSFSIDSALRRSLPIETGFTKFLDLDRCYSVSRIPVTNAYGAQADELVLYNLHLSAYTSDGTIATEQLRMLLEDMQNEYENGNYCIAGGDFNKDLLGDSAAYFGASDIEYTWAQPIPPETFDGVEIQLVAPLDEASPVPSCRNADGPYHEGQYVLTVDGFLVSPNVQVIESNVIDTQFRYSDHNPVYMDFVLMPYKT